MNGHRRKPPGVEFQQTGQSPRPRGAKGLLPSPPATWQTCVQHQTTSVLTAAMSVYALGAGITAAAGTRLALQLILITVFGLHPLQVPLITKDRQNCCSSLLPHQKLFDIGQFACLLPTLVVVAVSQAPSPESNTDSPLPVIANVVQYTTFTADRSEARMLKQCCGIATTLPAQLFPREPA